MGERLLELRRGVAAVSVALLAGIGTAACASEGQPESSAASSVAASELTPVARESGDMADGDDDHDGVPNMLDPHPGDNEAFQDHDGDTILDWGDVDFRTWRDPDADGIMEPYDSQPTVRNSKAYPQEGAPGIIGGWLAQKDADNDGIDNKHDPTPWPDVNDRDIDGYPDATDVAPDDPLLPDPHGEQKLRQRTDSETARQVWLHDRIAEQADMINKQLQARGVHK